MKLFLDTANIDEIRDGARLGVVSGVTTNPSLAASAGIGDREAYRSAVAEIASRFPAPSRASKPSPLWRPRVFGSTRPSASP